MIKTVSILSVHVHSSSFDGTNTNTVCSGSLMQMRLAPSRIGLRYLLMIMVWVGLRCHPHQRQTEVSNLLGWQQTQVQAMLCKPFGSERQSILLTLKSDHQSSDDDVPPSWLSQPSCPGSMQGQSWKWNLFMLLLHVINCCRLHLHSHICDHTLIQYRV